MPPKKSEAKTPETRTETGEGDLPQFTFPEEFYGNEWNTCASNMLYWVKYIPDGFVYGSEVHAEGGWAVVSDDGEKKIVSDEDFGNQYVPVSTQPLHEPSYIARESSTS